MNHRKTLVILSENFGTNYSGGTSATHFIFKLLQDQFEEIIFIGKEVGEHQFDNLTFRKYSSVFDAVSIIREIHKNRRAVYYGDFYMTCFFILARVPFYFTYHDNWPEQAGMSLKDRLRGLFYISIYKWIIRNSLWTFTVSDFKLGFVKTLTKNCSLVRNGMVLGPSRIKRPKDTSHTRIVMLGNIDARKYQWALELFRLIQSQGIKHLSVDIFGRAVDKRILKTLEEFPFVSFKGFRKDVRLSGYSLMLSTSQMENLAISVVEALKAHLPVVAFDVGGLNEVINNKNGILIKPGDVRSMLNEILNMSSREFVFDDDSLEEFDWTVAAGKYGDIILADSE